MFKESVSLKTQFKRESSFSIKKAIFFLEEFVSMLAVESVGATKQIATCTSGSATRGQKNGTNGATDGDAGTNCANGGARFRIRRSNTTEL